MELSELPVLCRLPKLELVELPDPQSEEEVDEFETVLLLVSSWHAVAALAAQPPRAAMMKVSLNCDVHCLSMDVQQLVAAAELVSWLADSLAPLVVRRPLLVAALPVPLVELEPLLIGVRSCLEIRVRGRRRPGRSMCVSPRSGRARMLVGRAQSA